MLTPLLLAAASLTAVPANASLIINATFDATINNDPGATAIKNTINTAIQTYQTLFSNDVTVQIYFQEGGGLGQSNFFIYNQKYSDVYAGLVANNANPDALAALDANNGNAGTNGGLNPVTGTTRIQIKSANARALGLAIDPGCFVSATGNGSTNGNTPNTCAGSGSGKAVDGIVSLNTAITDPPNPQGDPADQYSLLSVTEHEIDELLGLGSALRGCDPANPNASAACKANGNLNAGNNASFGIGSTEDLFRWSAATNGTRTLSTNCKTQTSAFFSYGPSTGAIAQFNNACNGGDFGDWQSSPLPAGVSAQVQDAFGAYGDGTSVGVSEIAALTAIGYTAATPEPGTWGMLLGSLLTLGVMKRRSSR